MQSLRERCIHKKILTAIDSVHQRSKRTCLIPTNCLIGISVITGVVGGILCGALLPTNHTTSPFHVGAVVDEDGIGRGTITD